ncbi:hypothetical protein [Nonomuraea insulae]|uniref:Uncharacterized protein n=1 Tax=Nonomuraea insulae TaxID=1616787 RepID=A0ABW1CKM8_9ACTN
MGDIIDFVSAVSLDRRGQQLTEAELDRLEELTVLFVVTPLP